MSLIPTASHWFEPRMGAHKVARVLIDNGSYADVLYLSTFLNMGYKTQDLRTSPIPTPLVGFSGTTVVPIRYIPVPVIFGKAPHSIVTSIDFL